MHSQLWQAELAKGYTSVDKGKTVRIIEAKGIKLIVEPETKNDQTRDLISPYIHLTVMFNISAMIY